jgi:hypothetical protein
LQFKWERQQKDVEKHSVKNPVNNVDIIFVNLQCEIVKAKKKQKNNNFILSQHLFLVYFDGIESAGISGNQLKQC